MKKLCVWVRSLGSSNYRWYDPTELDDLEVYHFSSALSLWRRAEREVEIGTGKRVLISNTKELFVRTARRLGYDVEFVQHNFHGGQVETDCDRRAYNAMVKFNRGRECLELPLVDFHNS